MNFDDKVKQALESTILDIANEYQQNSPIGATGQLKAGWDVDVITTNQGFTGVISNVSNASKYRALGRRSGKPPPTQDLIPWVQKKIEPDVKKAQRIAYLIGQKIAREGTQRYRENTNPFGLTREGQIKPELKQKFTQLLIKYLNRL